MSLWLKGWSKRSKLKIIMCINVNHVSRCVPPAGVCGSAVLQDVVGTESHDGFHSALQAVLWLDEHRVAHLPKVLSWYGTAHLKGSPAHWGGTDLLGHNVQRGTWKYRQSISEFINSLKERHHSAQQSVWGGNPPQCPAGSERRWHYELMCQHQNLTGVIRISVQYKGAKRTFPHSAKQAILCFVLLTAYCLKASLKANCFLGLIQNLCFFFTLSDYVT